MSGPITLDVLANVRPFQRGVDDIAEGIERVADAVDEMVDVAGDGADDASRSFKDLARDARKAGDDAGDGFKRGVSKGFDEAKKEAGQSGREAAASFSGEATDILDFAQETLANGLGPAGIAGAAILGSLAAVGLQWVEDMEARGQAIQENAGEMFGQLVEQGAGALQEAFIQSQMKDLLGGDDAKQLMQDLATESERLGVSQSTLLRARAGDQEALNAVLLAEADVHDRIVGSINQATEDGQAQLALEERKHQETLDAYEDQASAAQLAVDRANLYAGAVSAGNAQLGETIGKLQDIASRKQSLTNDTAVVRVTADMSDFERKVGLLEGRTITMKGNVITRIGNQVY